jgi:hypothetical protein
MTEGAELRWNAGNQTVTLLEIDHLCRLCSIEITALSAIAVATGPGSFNALRVGMSVAKGLAFALAIPVFGAGHWTQGIRRGTLLPVHVRAGWTTSGPPIFRVRTADPPWRNASPHAGRLSEGLPADALIGELPEREAMAR